MSAIDDSRVLGRTRLSFASQPDIDEFVRTLEAFENGDIGPDAWRAFRLVRGVYGQRYADDGQMIRCKIPQGILTHEQLEALADVTERYSRGFGHITTRQNVQFHFVPFSDVEAAMTRMAGAGLTTREACGNSVRNITTCPHAGVASDEVFDVTPYAEAMTRYFLRHPLSSSLPRKFKIAFEGCPDDHVFAPINDLGWIARERVHEGRRQRGFRLIVGGGTATMARSGYELFAFVPAGDILAVAEAVLRVFHRLGDYQHKQRNRMKFLIKTLGWDRWREEFERELAGVHAEGKPLLPFDPDDPPVEDAPEWNPPTAITPDEAAHRAASFRTTGPGIHPEVRTRLTVNSEEYLAWLGSNVRPQKQAGYAVATVRLNLGDITAAQMRIVADTATSFGDGLVRITPDQNVCIRWVAVEQLEAVHRVLAAAGLGASQANTLRDVTSCPGAESCKLAVTQSRGLARLLGEHLDDRAELVSQAPGATIKISGCPNGCGQHHIATFGFQGSVRKLDGHAVPTYFVLIGGGSTNEGASFGRLVAKVPARRVPDAVDRLIGLYVQHRSHGESAPAFFQRLDASLAKTALHDLEELSAHTVQPVDFVDLGEDRAFSPDVQEGECAA